MRYIKLIKYKDTIALLLSHNSRRVWTSTETSKCGAVVVWWSGGLSVELTLFRNHSLPFKNVGNFVHPTLFVFFWKNQDEPLVSSICVYVREVKYLHKEMEKTVVDSVHLIGLVISICKFTIPPKITIKPFFKYIHAASNYSTGYKPMR